jgi:hypothetical protein
MEKWLPVVGYEGLYEVSSRGKVRSLDHVVKNRYSTALRHGRTLKPTPDRAGYLQVPLSASNVVTTKKVHRLVASAFLGEPPHAKAHVNHLDFNKANNGVGNLQWCTPKQNHRHAVDAGRLDGAISPKRGKKLTIEKVLSIRAARKAGERRRVIAERFGICMHTVDRVVAGKIWGRV